jgi:diacylglycerol kinase family enzyme
VSRARIFALIFHFMRGTQVGQEPIRMARAQQVTVTAVEGTLPAHADGETLCTEATQLELRLLPGLVETVAPAEGAPS